MKNLRTFSLVAFTLLASPLSAAWVEFSPPAPTSQTPIAVTFTTDAGGNCGPTESSVTPSGNSVHVTLSRPADVPPCPPDGRPTTLRVELGTFPIGEYTLTADYQAMRWKSRFVVRNPSAHLAAASILGGFPVVLPPVSGDVSVTFGGIAATSVRRDSYGLVAVAPRHDLGLYDIRIATPDGQQLEIPAGIYYFDSGSPPDPTIFEPVLFPVLDSAVGAYGTRWTATATIQNNREFYIETFNRVDDIKCFTRPCMELRSPASAFDFAGVGFAHGALLWVPREEPGSMALGLRIAEASRGDDPGFELMPVRESQFLSRKITLLNVPVGDAYRTKIRIYGLDPLPVASVFVGTPSWGTLVPLQRGSGIGEPTYGEIDLNAIPELRGLENVTIDMHGFWGAPIWAFAAAVHNQSQRTIIIAPQ